MLDFLRILQLADSALPVGSAAHSFGLEMLVVDGDIEADVQNCPASLSFFLEDLLSESLALEAVFCREAHARAANGMSVIDLNQQLSAVRLARESREASLATGSRLAGLAAALYPIPELTGLAGTRELHYSVVFGYTSGLLAIDADVTAGAFVHQSILSAISAAQRLVPLGQMHASLIAWRLKAAIAQTLEQSRRESPYTAGSFTHLPELAAMRHSVLPTRLFIS